MTINNPHTPDTTQPETPEKAPYTRVRTINISGTPLIVSKIDALNYLGISQDSLDIAGNKGTDSLIIHVSDLDIIIRSLTQIRNEFIYGVKIVSE